MRFRIPSRPARRRPIIVAASLATLLAAGALRPTTVASQSRPAVVRGTGSALAPVPLPARWLGLIGEYGTDSAVTLVLERGGWLWLHTAASEIPIAEQRDSTFAVPGGGRVVFRRDAAGRATRLEENGSTLARRQIGPTSGNQLVITPVRPIAELRREALAAKPPVEHGSFLPSDLVELTKLDPTIHLEIRYATSNNLFGTPFYLQARAFLQRPAAEALVRANARLRPLGYGLLVHDGYRPWYVTKMFWDAAPEDKHIFVANPAEGSKHNRGAAVDLTLYDLATGTPIEMVSTYDETSPRAYPDYPGGTSRQRWHRALLRRAMEAERFSVYETEWWHFDFADWQRYPIGNTVFERIGVR